MDIQTRAISPPPRRETDPICARLFVLLPRPNRVLTLEVWTLIPYPDANLSFFPDVIVRFVLPVSRLYSFHNNIFIKYNKRLAILQHVCNFILTRFQLV